MKDSWSAPFRGRQCYTLCLQALGLRLQSPYTWSLHAPPSAEILKKSQKGLPGVSKKCQKQSTNTDFDPFLTLFRVLRDFFDTSLTLRAERPGKIFLRLYRGFRRSGVWRLLRMGIAIATLGHAHSGIARGVPRGTENQRNIERLPYLSLGLLLLVAK